MAILSGKTLEMYARRLVCALAHAVIAPGAPFSPQLVKMKYFHCAHAHIRKDLLRKTAKQVGVRLTRELQPCCG